MNRAHKLSNSEIAQNNAFKYEGGLISLCFLKKTTSYGIEKMYLLYIFPLELHTLIYDFVVLTSLTNPRKILFVVLQTGK
jgi:hypothetical protein